MSSDRSITTTLRTRALAGMLAACLLITACSSGTPEPTQTPEPTPLPAPVEATVGVSADSAQSTPESVLAPLQPTAIPLATTADASALQSPIAAPAAPAADAVTQTVESAPASPAPIGAPIGVATAGTFVEDSALCAQFIGQDVPEALLPYLRCGTFSVPEEHAKPDGRQIKLPVVVIKSASAKPAPDPVLVLQGGPGGSGIRDYFNLILREGFKPGEDRDVILVDQRGSFLTEPALICTEYRDLYIKQIETAALGDAAAAERQAANAACKARLEAAGINLSAYNSYENAADIAALPRKLGYTDYNIYGISYGSLLAQHILALYPQGVRSLILDGVMPRAGNYTLTRNGNFEQTVKQVLAACAADELCAQDFPDVEARLVKLASELNASPAAMEISSDAFTQTVTISAPLTGLQLMATIYYMLQGSEGIGRVPRLVDMVEKGDLSYLAQLRNDYELKPLRDTTLGLFNSILCSEETNYTPEDAAAADAQTQPEFQVFRNAAEIAALCQAWGVPQLPADAQTAVQSSIPVLVLNGQFDPTTPAADSQQATRGFANLTSVTFPGEGHGQFPHNQCAASLVSNFLNAPTVELDTQCAATQASLEFSTLSTRLVDFTDVNAGLGGVRPAGWLPLRGGFADDVSGARILYQAGPSSDVAAVARRITQGDLTRTDTISSSAGITWTLYSGRLSGDDAALVDYAVGNGGLYVIEMVTDNAEQREKLHSELFLPAVDKFIAIKAPPQTILLTAPQPEAELTSPARLSGIVAKTPFENNLTYRIYNGAGLIINEGPINVKGELDSPGVFAAVLPFTVTQREAGRIEVVDIDAATGDPFASAAVTVTLTPVNIEGVRPPVTITIDLPQPNAVITSPAQVQGSISLSPFENNLVYRVFDGAGTEIGVGPITTQGELGMPGTFDATITFTATQGGPGRLLIEDDNEAGGPPLATAAIDVQLAGSAAEPAAVAPATVVTPTAAVTTTEAMTMTPTAEVTPTATITATDAITAAAAITTTAAAAATATVTATEAITPSASAAVIVTVSLDVNNFSLDPDGVARSVSKAVLPAVPYDPNVPPGDNGVPERVRFSFDRDQLESYFAPRQRQLLIMPVEGYRALYSGDALTRLDEQIARLKGLLANRPATVTTEIPVLPMIATSQVFRTNVDYVDFAGGACVRFISAFRLDVSPITDADTVYTCQGLSDDGRYYVSFTYPVGTTATPASVNDVTRAEQAQIDANFNGYLANLTARLNRLSPQNFRPTLTRLDEMLRTLAIK